MSIENASILLVNRAIIVDQQKILLVQRSAQDSYKPNEWEFPGGKVDAGEDLTTALIREVHEETGLTIMPISSMVHVEHEPVVTGKYAGRLYVALFHVARRLSGDTIVSDEHEGFVWDSVDAAIARSLTDESRRALEAFSNTGDLLY